MNACKARTNAQNVPPWRTSTHTQPRSNSDQGAAIPRAPRPGVLARALTPSLTCPLPSRLRGGWHVARRLSQRSWQAPRTLPKVSRGAQRCVAPRFQGGTLPRRAPSSRPGMVAQRTGREVWAEQRAGARTPRCGGRRVVPLEAAESRTTELRRSLDLSDLGAHVRKALARDEAWIATGRSSGPFRPRSLAKRAAAHDFRAAVVTASYAHESLLDPLLDLTP